MKVAIGFIRLPSFSSFEYNGVNIINNFRWLLLKKPFDTFISKFSKINPKSA